ncbi:hypothetical protein SAMN05216421_1080 [Halopseudomonas xinjiangensis]|uniref:Uncharacterized protein n=1 Tax=Halopseudomonas xinjiangensis TaxID=487184 RepID=A0A1H1Q8V6_9GAMM|nr:hypothetical protein [Halopseudomonas xinjiangensis]SDS19717.1 hypothetical protein SAMN05216421_1080 [Halopseudomonas xinjiangensis]
MHTKDCARLAGLLLAPAGLIVIGSLALMMLPIRPPGSTGYELDPMRWVPVGLTFGGLVWLTAAMGRLVKWEFEAEREEG